MTVDRDSALPLWAQVLGDLRRRLARGEFRLRFPGDHELTEQYGVSRHTVREAVRRLQDEGVLERGRGRGTFVIHGAIEQPLGALYSLFRSVEEQGFVQRSVVRYLEIRHNEEAAKVLGRAPDEPLVYLERLRLADEVAIVLDCSWLPAALAEPLLGVDFTRTALYRELHVRCGVRPDAGWERIRPVLPDPRQRALLGLRAGVRPWPSSAWPPGRPRRWNGGTGWSGPTASPTWPGGRPRTRGPGSSRPQGRLADASTTGIMPVLVYCHRTTCISVTRTSVTFICRRASVQAARSSAARTGPVKYTRLTYQRAGGGSRFGASLGAQRGIEPGGQVIGGSISRDGPRHDRDRRQDQASDREPDRAGGLRRRTQRRRVAGHEPVACRDRPAAPLQVPPHGQVRATRGTGQPVVRADHGRGGPGRLVDGAGGPRIGPQHRAGRPARAAAGRSLLGLVGTRQHGPPPVSVQTRKRLVVHHMSRTRSVRGWAQQMRTSPSGGGSSGSGA